MLIGHWNRTTPLLMLCSASECVRVKDNYLPIKVEVTSFSFASIMIDFWWNFFLNRFENFGVVKNLIFTKHFCLNDKIFLTVPFANQLNEKKKSVWST